MVNQMPPAFTPLRPMVVSENTDPLFPDLLSFPEKLDSSVESPDFQMLGTNSIFFMVYRKRKNHTNTPLAASIGQIRPTEH